MKARRLALALLVLAGCGPTIARPRITAVSPSTYSPGPTAVGQAVDVDYHRAHFSGLAPAPALRKYLQEILDTLLVHSPVTGIPARVYIKATSVFGAESSADANIYVNFRTLEKLTSKDEAAALLAHELAHVILAHPSSDIVEDVQAKLLTYTTVALAIHGAVARETGVATGLPMHVGVTMAEALLLQLNQGVVGPAWVRAQEENADLLGLDLLIRAGYAPTAMEILLDTILEAEKDQLDERSFGNKLGTLFKDNWPALIQAGSDRVTELVFKTAVEHMVNWFKRDHPDTAKRKELVAKYRAAHYAHVAPKDLDEDAWHQATRKKDRATKRLFQSYGNAITAGQLLLDKDTKAALKIASEAAGKDMRDHTFVAQALYRVQNAAGARRQTAEQLFDPPVRGSEPAWLAFREIGYAQIARGKPANGLATLERGYQRLQKPPDAIGALLFAYERAGKKEKAAALVTDCTARFPAWASRGGCRAVDPEQEGKTPGGAQEAQDGKQWHSPSSWDIRSIPFAPPGIGR